MAEPDRNDEPRLPEPNRLESIVCAAGGYLQPTEDLRPNTLEAARDACRQRRTNRRLGSLALCTLLLAATGLLDSFASSSPVGFSFVQSSELHRRAAQSSAKSGVGTNWALYEVFSELRREQAHLLNPSD